MLRRSFLLRWFRTVTSDGI